MVSTAIPASFLTSFKLLKHHNTQINSFSISISKQSTHLKLNNDFLWCQHILALLANNSDRKNAKKD